MGKGVLEIMFKNGSIGYEIKDRNVEGIMTGNMCMKERLTVYDRGQHVVTE